MSAKVASTPHENPSVAQRSAIKTMPLGICEHHEQVDPNLAKPISLKQTTVAQAAIEMDYTVRKPHAVGQLVHNLHKVNRTLQKIGYTHPVSQTALEQGDPATYTQILKFLLFRSSKLMREHLECKGISLQTEYLSERKFILALTSICASLFSYRVVLTPDQYQQMAAAERKLVIVLDLYDIVKQVRSQSKIDIKLETRDPKWEHPCDVALKNYVLCDHQENVKKDMQFRINATLLKSNLEVMNLQHIEEVDAKPKENEDMQSQGGQSVMSKQSNAYSVTNHFKNAERNSKANMRSTGIISSQKDQTMGESMRKGEVTGLTRGPPKETSFGNTKTIIEQPADEEDVEESPKVSTSVINTSQENKQKEQMIQQITMAVGELGSQFVQMGANVESKLSQIEKQHKELEARLAQSQSMTANDQLFSEIHQTNSGVPDEQNDRADY